MLTHKTQAALVIGSTLFFSTGASATTISLSELASHLFSSALSATVETVQSSVRTDVMFAAQQALNEPASVTEALDVQPEASQAKPQEQQNEEDQ